jgi:hypothetical protein
MDKKASRNIFAGVGVIILAVIVTTGLLATFLNHRCQSRFRESLAFYPGAEIVVEESPFLAMQRVELYSADPPETVQAWYTSRRAAAMRARVESGDFSELPPENWIIEPAVDRAGSTITLSEVCP